MLFKKSEKLEIAQFQHWFRWWAGRESTRWSVSWRVSGLLAFYPMGPLGFKRWLTYLLYVHVCFPGQKELIIRRLGKRASSHPTLFEESFEVMTHEINNWSGTKHWRKDFPQNLLKVYVRAKWHIRSEFCSMNRLGVFLLLNGWDASPLQGYYHHEIPPIPIFTPGCRETLWE